MAVVPLSPICNWGFTVKFRRRAFAAASVVGMGATVLSKSIYSDDVAVADESQEQEQLNAPFGFGLVTYMWGADWDLETLLKNCETVGMQGVELRTTHAHKVEPTLTMEQREEVRARFADSSVTLVGIGSDERFDNPDPQIVKNAIEATKDFVRLSHDVGGSGVKVKPDRFHAGVPREKTIEQIGKALNELGEYALGFGQQIRLEIHGECSPIPITKQILDIATHPNVFVCWNSNVVDLEGAGLKANFETVRERFGNTLHVRELNSKDYPFADLISLLVKTEYSGYVLLEAASKPSDRIEALKGQMALMRDFVKKA